MTDTKPQPIEILVQEGELSEEVARRLKSNWIASCDELYLRMKACIFAKNPDMEEAMEKELGISNKKLRDFMAYLQKYVSSEVVNAEKPREYPLGYII